ncbi:hypothetical protein VNO77_16272 [Canavalia gladiata]|uniref:Uncharacterized protein n=1 Tax=Canavalia gladiata TaxID=3824 RepID=A0AAN9QRW3_CANGL
MPSVPVGSLRRHLVPSLVIFHGVPFSHRLKHLEKSDRRAESRCSESRCLQLSVFEVLPFAAANAVV